MQQVHRMLPLAALITVLSAAPVAAQQALAAKPTPPATISTNSASKSGSTGSSEASAKIEQGWDRTKAITRKEWNAAKRKWAVEKVKWRDCNKQAEAERLTAPKSWSFVAGCMTGS